MDEEIQRLAEGVSHLTFDCYGTLIDWEQGILRAVRSISGAEQPDEKSILQSYVRHEARLEFEPWQPYRNVLRGVMHGIAADLHLKLRDSDADVLATSLPNWPPYPDTTEALRRLSELFRLVIVSNIDDAFFAKTQQRLGVQFDEVITAEQVRSYKPALGHFHETLRRLNVTASRILHVAQSLYHDHVPAKSLGIRTVWVNRPSLLGQTGLAPETAAAPDMVVPDLATLARQIT